MVEQSRNSCTTKYTSSNFMMIEPLATVVSTNEAAPIAITAVLARRVPMLNASGLLTAMRRSTDTNTSRYMEKIIDKLMTNINISCITTVIGATVRTMPQTHIAVSAIAKANRYTFVDDVIFVT